MYASSSKTLKVNVLWHEMFLTKRDEVDSNTIPPCEDSLQLHIQSNYQAGVWHMSLQRNPYVPEPNCHGWFTEEWLNVWTLCSRCSVRTAFMSMQKRMLTRTVALFDQLPQMHLYVPATDVRKSKRGWRLQNTRVRFRMLWFRWSRVLRENELLASTSYYKTANNRQLLLW